MKIIGPKIVAWQQQHGRHHLPWQKRQTPYRVWVSEIMLQQTQVSTVIPYFKTFMQTFPSLKKLAQASEDEVMHHWTGLGYYRRAQNLHRCAQQVLQQHRGRFPSDQNDLEALPGIGRSTAAAIRSLAFKQRACILDGNVKRILARCFCVDGDIKQSRTQKKLWQIAEAQTPEQDAAIYNQGMMDLGATLCLRKQPLCQRCPLQHCCQAHQQGRVEQYPQATKAVRKQQLSLFLLRIRSPQHCVLQKRPSNGIWAKLWCFPSFASTKDLQQWVKQTLNSRATLGKRLQHTLTHRELDIRIYDVQLKRRRPLQLDDYCWHVLGDTPPGGLAAPIKNALLAL